MNAASLAIPCLLLLFGLQTLAQRPTQVRPTPEPALPPAAQEAFDKGVIAAKIPDYLLAIRYFQEARKIAPDASVIYLNLGLAESKIPGRELRAIAWFGAYLVASPNAGNAAAVKEQIAILAVRNQSNTSRFLQKVQDAASQLPDDKYVRQIALERVAPLWAKTGDILTALKVANLFQEEWIKRDIYWSIARALAEAGDFAEALKTTYLIAEGEGQIRGYSLTTIAIAQIEADDMAGARNTLASALRAFDLVKYDFNYELRLQAQSKFAIAQINAGDIAGARTTLSFAQKNDDLIPVDRGDSARSDFAGVKAKIGDIAGAQKTIDLIKDGFWKDNGLMFIAQAQAESSDIAGALRTADLIQNVDRKGYALSYIAEAYARSGDSAAALKIADVIADARIKSDTQARITLAQIKAGDVAGAQKTADLIQSSYYKPRAQRAIAEAQAKNAANAPRRAEPDWLRKLDDDNMDNDCPLNTEPFLDLAAYLKSLPPSDDPEKVFYALHKTAEKIITAQNVISKMLKQQSAQQARKP
jgi:hypothetical protein